MSRTTWKNDKGKFRDGIGTWENETKRPSPQQRNTFSTDIQPEKAILVAVCQSGQTIERTAEYLAELAFLLETAGGVAVKQVIQRLERADTRTYVGSGKLDEIKEYLQALDADFPRSSATSRKNYYAASSTAHRSSSTYSPNARAPP